MGTVQIGSTSFIIYFILLYSYTKFEVILVANLFLGLGLTFFSGADESYLYEHNTNFEVVIRNYMLIGSISIGVAMMIGGLLSDISWKYVFLLGAVIQLIGLLLIISLPGDTKSCKIKESESVSLYKLIIILTRSKNIYIIISFLLIDSFFWFYYMVEQVNLSFVGLTNSSIGFVYLVISVLIMLLTKYEISFNDDNIYINLMLLISVFIVIINLSFPIIEIIMLCLSQMYLFIYFPKFSNKVHEMLENEHRNMLISLLYSISSLLILLYFTIYNYLNVEFYNISSVYIMFILIIILILVSKKSIKKYN